MRTICDLLRTLANAVALGDFHANACFAVLFALMLDCCSPNRWLADSKRMRTCVHM